MDPSSAVPGSAELVCLLVQSEESDQCLTKVNQVGPSDLQWPSCSTFIDGLKTGKTIPQSSNSRKTDSTPTTTTATTNKVAKLTQFKPNILHRRCTKGFSSIIVVDGDCESQSSQLNGISAAEANAYLKEANVAFQQFKDVIQHRPSIKSIDKTLATPYLLSSGVSLLTKVKKKQPTADPVLTRRSRRSFIECAKTDVTDESKYSRGQRYEVIKVSSTPDISGVLGLSSEVNDQQRICCIKENAAVPIATTAPVVARKELGEERAKLRTDTLRNSLKKYSRKSTKGVPTVRVNGTVNRTPQELLSVSTEIEEVRKPEADQLATSDCTASAETTVLVAATPDTDQNSDLPSSLSTSSRIVDDILDETPSEIVTQSPDSCSSIRKNDVAVPASEGASQSLSQLSSSKSVSLPCYQSSESPAGVPDCGFSFSKAEIDESHSKKKRLSQSKVSKRNQSKRPHVHEDNYAMYSGNLNGGNGFLHNVKHRSDHLSSDYGSLAPVVNDKNRDQLLHIKWLSNTKCHVWQFLCESFKGPR